MQIRYIGTEMRRRIDKYGMAGAASTNRQPSDPLITYVALSSKLQSSIMTEKAVLANLLLPPLPGLSNSSPHHKPIRTLFGHRTIMERDEEDLNLSSNI